MAILRSAVRSWVKDPGFFTTVTLSLALSIGASCTIYSVIHRAILQRPPYEHPERLVVIWESSPTRVRRAAALANIEEWRRAVDSIERIEYFGRDTRPAMLLRQNQAERVIAQDVSPGLFEFLGVKPVLGRVFLEREVEQGRGVVMVSQHYWRERLGGDTGILGETVVIDRVPYDIVGVLPRDVDLFTDFYGADFVMPADPRQGGAAAKNARRWRAVGRLKEGVPLSRAQTGLRIWASRLETVLPNLDRGWTAYPQDFQEALVAIYKPALLPLFGAVLMLLFIACANVSNMLLMQAVRRRKEIAIRAALGASGSRVVRQLLVEGVLLVVPANLLGVGLTHWGLLLVDRTAPLWFTSKFGGDTAVNGPVLVFALVLCAAVGIGIGLLPAWHVSRTNLVDAVKAGGRTSGSASISRVRGGLVVAEVALAFLLMAGAGLMIGSMYRQYKRTMGYDASQVFSAQLDLDGPRYVRSEQPRTAGEAAVSPEREFCRNLVERLQRLPGVERVAISGDLPVGDAGAVPVRTPGQDRRPEAQEAGLRNVSSEYLQTLKIPLQQGRFFTDAASGAPVAVISDGLARRVWAGENPIGRRILAGEGSSAIPMEVVGVVSDVARVNSPELEADLYIPFFQRTDAAPQSPPKATHVTLLVRARSTSASLPAAIRSAVADLDHSVAVYATEPLESLLDESRSSTRFYLVLLVAFAGIAMVLAAIGIYGVMSYAVTHRFNEIAVRMAVGATGGRILLLVLGGALKLTAIGLAVGLTGSLVLTRLIREVLFGIRPTDPFTLVLTASLFTAIALFASVQPARRAMQLDPGTALRKE